MVTAVQFFHTPTAVWNGKS